MNTHEGTQENENSEKKRTKKVPMVEMNLRISKDKRYFMVIRSETTIYPINYISKMLQNSFEESMEVEN